ncbi:MAG: NAD-dependent epimerase/dehydratase family protein [Candidatus Paracaedibacter sp.]
MSTYLITGASGFFGKSMIQSLKQAKEDDHFICLYHSKRPEIEDSRFSWIKVDLLDLSTHSDLIQKYQPTYCAHLAWHVPPQNFWQAEENLDWLRASVHLFQTFCEGGGKIFLGAGSLAEYTWSTGVLYENTPLVPRSLYGQCKKSLYEILKVIRDSKYKDSTIIWPRIGYFFGPDEPPQKLISKIIDSLKKGASLNLVSKDTKRPYAHVKYLGESLAHIFFNQTEDLVFNLSASKAYSLKEIVDFVSNKLNIDQDHVSYDTYTSPNPEPLDMEVHTDILNSQLGINIPDTFFENLREIIEGNNVKI